MKNRKSGLLVLLIVAVVVAGGCGGDQKKRVIAFVQATKDPSVNQLIMERYAWPIFRGLEKSGEPFQLDLYGISGHTAGSSAFYSATVRRGPTQGIERKDAEQRFLQLRRVLDKTYGPKESQLVDVLGSLRTVDDTLGGSSEGPLYVIYVSDMVQSSGGSGEGYDFTGFYGGRSLDDCRKHLSAEVGDRLLNKARFSSARVLVVKLDLQALFREKGTETEAPPPNLGDIDAFWANDVFRGLLKVASYHVDSAKDPRRAIRDFLW